MQKVFLWSSVTYECTQVTPSSEFVPTTDMHACAPASVRGISRPSGNVRSTMKRATTDLLADAARVGCLFEQARSAFQFRHPREGSTGAQFRCSFRASQVAICTRESKP